MKNIKDLFKNEVTKRILLFFNENPNSIDTVKGISVWVECDIDAAQKALNRLVDRGVLINHKTASTNAYSYTNERPIVKKIEKHIKDLT
jgi:predicted transcriptional regulator